MRKVKKNNSKLLRLVENDDANITLKVKQEEDKIINYQNEIEEYLSLINKVAIVFMFNPNTTIFYVNDFFKELIKCLNLF